MAHTTERPRIAPHAVAEERARVELNRVIEQRRQEQQAVKRHPRSSIPFTRLIQGLGASTRRAFWPAAKE